MNHEFNYEVFFKKMRNVDVEMMRGRDSKRDHWWTGRLDATLQVRIGSGSNVLGAEEERNENL